MLHLSFFFDIFFIDGLGLIISLSITFTEAPTFSAGLFIFWKKSSINLSGSSLSMKFEWIVSFSLIWTFKFSFISSSLSKSLKMKEYETVLIQIKIIKSNTSTQCFAQRIFEAQIQGLCLHCPCKAKANKCRFQDRF